MEPKNEINDLKARLAPLETMTNSPLIVYGTTNNGTYAQKEQRI